MRLHVGKEGSAQVGRENTIVTLSGAEIDFANLSGVAKSIYLWDIIWPLHFQIRWTGQIPVMWDVLSHSVLCWVLGKRNIPDLNKHEEAWLLLHDATEAYMADVPRPLKGLIPDYKVLEDLLASGVMERFGVDMSKVRLDLMKKMDDYALVTEGRWFGRTLEGLETPSQECSATKVTPKQFRDKMLEVCTHLGTRDTGLLFAVPPSLTEYVNLEAEDAE